MNARLQQLLSTPLYPAVLEDSPHSPHIPFKRSAEVPPPKVPAILAAQAASVPRFDLAAVIGSDCEIEQPATCRRITAILDKNLSDRRVWPQLLDFYLQALMASKDVTLLFTMQATFFPEARREFATALITKLLAAPVSKENIALHVQYACLHRHAVGMLQNTAQRNKEIQDTGKKLFDKARRYNRHHPLVIAEGTLRRIQEPGQINLADHMPALDAALSKEPDHAWLLQARASLLLHCDQAAEALKSAQAWQRVEPDNEDAEDFCHKCEAAIAAKRNAAEQERYDRQTAVFKTWREANHCRRTGDQVQALKILIGAMETYPHEGIFPLRYADIFCQLNPLPGDAVEIVNRCIERMEKVDPVRQLERYTRTDATRLFDISLFCLTRAPQALTERCIKLGQRLFSYDIGFTEKLPRELDAAYTGTPISEIPFLQQPIRADTAKQQSGPRPAKELKHG